MEGGLKRMAFGTVTYFEVKTDDCPYYRKGRPVSGSATCLAAAASRGLDAPAQTALARRNRRGAAAAKRTVPPHAKRSKNLKWELSRWSPRAIPFVRGSSKAARGLFENRKPLWPVMMQLRARLVQQNASKCITFSTGEMSQLSHLEKMRFGTREQERAWPGVARPALRAARRTWDTSENMGAAMGLEAAHANGPASRLFDHEQDAT